jgi:hypothetical protein
VEGAVKALKVTYSDTPIQYARWRVKDWLKAGLITSARRSVRRSETMSTDEESLTRYPNPPDNEEEPE